MSRKSEEAQIELRRKTVAANLIGGLNYRDLAETLGVSIGTIASDVKVILGRWRREQVDATDDWVHLEARRLDKMLNAIWNNVIAGDLACLDRALKIMERRAKLLGLDAPEQNRNLNLDLLQCTDEQLERISRGEDPLTVLLTGRSGAGTAPATRVRNHAGDALV